MIDFYQTLGVAPDASPDDIKAAYRRAVLASHPDTNPGAGRGRFHEVQEAYAVLRDEGKRAQYDLMRKEGFTVSDWEEASAGGGFDTPWGQPSMDGRDFDRAFDEWWKRMSDEFKDYEEQQFAKERMNAERMATAAAWEWEKEQAQLNKARVQRLKWRTEDARMQRHATTLRRFWQTHLGFTPGDAVFVALFLAGAAGIALTWRSHLQTVRQGQPPQRQQQREGQPEQQPAAPQQQQQRQQQHVQPPSLPIAAAVAASAAATQPPA